VRERGGHASSRGLKLRPGIQREHATLAPRFLGWQLVLAKTFARIHGQNFPTRNLPLTFADPADYDAIVQATC